MKALAILACVLSLSLSHAPAQISDSPDSHLAEAFWAWEESAPPSDAEQETVARYRAKLKNDGLSERAIDDTIVRLKHELLRQDGEFYDGIYAKGAPAGRGPNQLLVQAVKGVRPGAALDVAMGQGRNSLFLAAQGWRVTGFDISRVGLRQADENAKKSGLQIHTVLSGDESFPFGRSQWDLIAIIYALEKRSVRRVSEALKPGGIVVVESGNKKASGAPFEYQHNELRDLFQHFEILKYEETTEKGDWGEKPYPRVRLIARKPAKKPHGR